jgi:hypothetical protein
MEANILKVKIRNFVPNAPSAYFGFYSQKSSLFDETTEITC